MSIITSVIEDIKKECESKNIFCITCKHTHYINLIKKELYLKMDELIKTR